MEETTTKKLRGFAVLKARGVNISEISRLGGKAAHVAGTAHEFSSEEAREAGRKGGKANAARKAAVRAQQATDAGQ